jgi:hypothetical protein
MPGNAVNGMLIPTIPDLMRAATRWPRAWIAIGMVVLASAGAARRRPAAAPVDA